MYLVKCHRNSAFNMLKALANKPIVGVPLGAAASEFIDQTTVGKGYDFTRIFTKAVSSGLLPYTPAPKEK